MRRFSPGKSWILPILKNWMHILGAMDVGGQTRIICANCEGNVIPTIPSLSMIIVTLSHDLKGSSVMKVLILVTTTLATTRKLTLAHLVE